MDKPHLKEIADYLCSLSDDPQVCLLLGYSVGRVLTKEADRGRDWRAMADAVDLPHVSDFIAAAVVNEERWLSNTDEKGRPKKLMKFGSLDDMVREADKAMAKAAQRSAAPLRDGDEALVMELSDGFRVVRMLTPAALDAETAVMQHCIGSGAYDSRVGDDNKRYLSIRDRAGKPHATIEIDLPTRKVLQISGKQNGLPNLKYATAIAEYLRAEGDGLELPMLENHYFDADFVIRNLADLRSGDFIRGHLYVDSELPVRIPADIKVERSVHISGKDVSFDGSIKAGDALVIGNCKVTGKAEHLEAGGWLKIDKVEFSDGAALQRVEAATLYLEQTNLRSWPRTVSADRIAIVSCPFLEIPADLTIFSGIHLEDLPMTRLPEVGSPHDLYLVDMHVTALPELSILGNLMISNTPIETLPDTLTRIPGDLSLRNCPIVRLPEGLRVGGDLDISGSGITTLPLDIEIGGALDAKNSALQSVGGLRKVPYTMKVEGSQLAEIPDGFSVGSTLYACRTPLERIGAGVILGGTSNYLYNSRLRTLPDDLYVDGNLDVSNCLIESVPEAFSLNGNLTLDGNPITSLPESLHVRKLSIKNTGIGAIPLGVLFLSLEAEGTPFERGDPPASWPTKAIRAVGNAFRR